MKMLSMTQQQGSVDLQTIIPPIASQPEYSAEPQTGSLLDYWHSLSKRKFRLAVFGLIGLGLGVLAAVSQTPMYRATTSLEMQNMKDGDLGAKILNPQPDSPNVDATTDIQTQIEILQSRSLIDRAVIKSHLSLPDLDRRSTWLALWTKVFPASAPQTNRDSVIDDLTNRLKVSAIGETRVVDVSFDAANPATAANFANILTSEYIEQNLDARLQLNRKTSDWLVSQLEEARGKLQRSEDDLQAYARRKGLIYTGDQQNISEEKLREVQSELSKAQADRVDKQSRVEIARTATPESIPEVLNDSSLRAMESNLVDLRKQEAEMGVTFKPNYSQVKKLQAQIESLESDIASTRAVILKRLDDELRESERREQLLSAAYALQTRLVTDDSQNSIQYDMLKHDVDTNRQIYQIMLQRVKESSIASALKATNVRVIDPALAPLRPYKPNLPMNAAAGLFIGLMLGVAGIVIGSKANDCLNEPGEASMLLGVPELGFVPIAESKPATASTMQKLFSPKPQNEKQGVQVFSVSNRSSMFADSFRAIIASIIFAASRERQRVLVVTSASQSEGKTTTASNLAASLANMGRKVLLIDGDIRSPKLHNLFGLDNAAGLTTTLKSIALHETKASGFIRKTSIPNLDVLTSGPAIQAGADLLFSTLMPILVAQYREEYEMVLIDTPPMLVMPDARALGRVADAVILVARAGQTTRSALQTAYRRFLEDRTAVLGVVLNSWNAKMSVHKYYSTYQEPTAEHALVQTTSAQA